MRSLGRRGWGLLDVLEREEAKKEKWSQRSLDRLAAEKVTSMGSKQRSGLIKSLQQFGGVDSMGSQRRL